MKKNPKINTILSEIIDYENKVNLHTNKKKSVTKDQTINRKIDSLFKYAELINKNYYTFKPEPEKGKRLFAIRQAIFKWLFKYSFRQIIFNEYIKNYVNASNDLILQLIKKVNQIEKNT